LVAEVGDRVRTKDGWGTVTEVDGDLLVVVPDVVEVDGVKRAVVVSGRPESKDILEEE
jgi:hypothetical protein